MAEQRIKITSDGTSAGTIVTDMDTGVEIQGITALSWQCDAEHQVARATVEFILVDVEVMGQVHATEREQHILHLGGLLAIAEDEERAMDARALRKAVAYLQRKPVCPDCTP